MKNGTRVILSSICMLLFILLAYGSNESSQINSVENARKYIQGTWYTKTQFSGEGFVRRLNFSNDGRFVLEEAPMTTGLYERSVSGRYGVIMKRNTSSAEKEYYVTLGQWYDELQITENYLLHTDYFSRENPLE